MGKYSKKCAVNNLIYFNFIVFFKNFREENNLISSFPCFNSGVTFCDNLTAKKLSEYMLNRLKKNIGAKAKNSHNMLLN